MKPHEVAEIMQIHKRTLFRLLRANKIRHIRTGLRPETWRITSQALDEYLGQQATAPEATQKEVTPSSPKKRVIRIPDFKSRARAS